jgi:hypothetical protein
VQGGPIVVLGDTQRTLWSESFFCGREQNERESQALIDKLASEEHPAFVVHLGDMVSVGSSSAEWAYFDRLIKPLGERGIRVRPVFGNHDLWGERRVALRNARARFPELANDAYAARHDELALIWLNSNLEGEAARRQAVWFEQALRVFDGPGTRGVLVFLHHPAYTNGHKRSPSSYVTSELVPRFLAAKKTLVMLSAHVHGYERFYADKRWFVVSGGAGGPRVEYETGKAAPSTSALTTETIGPRPFHYLVIEKRDNTLHFEAKCGRRSSDCPSGVFDQFSVALHDAK